MRILMVSFFFPPYNTIGAVRAGKTAKFLSRFGHEVRIVTAAPQPYQATLPQEVDAQQVTRTAWFNVNRPVEMLLGGRQRVAARGFPGARDRRSLVGRMAQLYRTLLHAPDAQIGWFPFAHRATSRIVHEWRPDVVFASAMPITSLLVAARVARRRGLPWVAELRDLWVDNSQYAHPPWRRQLEQRLERRVLRSATGIVTVSDAWAERLRAKFGRPTAAVLNGFDPADYPPDEQTAPAVAASGTKLRIVYTGMLYPGSQDPRPLFEAISRLGPLKQQVQVEFCGRYVAAVSSLAARYAVSDVVRISQTVPYREALEKQRLADVLLLLLWTDRRVRGIYSGKLFEYLGARRPILAIGPGHDLPAELIRARRRGPVLEHPQAIEAQLREWIARKQRGERLPDLPAADVADLSREAQTRRLERFLEEVVGETAGHRRPAALPRAA